VAQTPHGGKRRLGELTADDAVILTQAFEADCHGTDSEAPRFAAVTVTTPVLDEAAILVAIHALRAYDGVQLASALAARAADPGCDRFACFDKPLRDAAAKQGFALIP